MSHWRSQRSRCSLVQTGPVVPLLDVGGTLVRSRFPGHGICNHLLSYEDHLTAHREREGQLVVVIGKLEIVATFYGWIE